MRAALRQRPSRRLGARSNHLLYPLDMVYRSAGVAVPLAREIAPDDIPHPYRGLLSHRSDMTQTLERHYGGRINIRALSTSHRGRWYMRRVLLVQEYSGRPVEMGAIRIALDVFSAPVRAQILKGHVPLGRIMRDAALDYHSRPSAFFEITPNSDMMGVFWMREPRALYGRQTEVTLGGTKFGDIVEVLPLV
jgi:chorismate-pyruvate lyase